MSKSVLDLIGNTPLVLSRTLNTNPKVDLYFKLEGQNPGGSVKDRPAYNMIKRALERGEISKETRLIEATSGNTGIALAMIAGLYDLNIELVMPENATKERVQTILDEVGLNAGDMDKFPHEFSGGQRQRIAIARALITKPSLIVADESVSALDVSVQAQVLNLMMDLQKKFNLTFVFISHDLSVVEYITTKMIVIYLGRVVKSRKAVSR